MGVTVSGLQFHPLYWVFHDSWRWIIPSTSGNPIVKRHHGHVHFFMLNYNWGAAGQDAFTGEMRYRFELKDVWGPRSNDPNQQQQYRVIGTPKWYFHVQEVWRRVYVQQWDDIANDPADGGFLAKRGIKYDASQPAQTFGPFREGRDYTPYFLHSARTLPVEYYTTAAKDRAFRDNYVQQKWMAVPAADKSMPHDPAFYVPPANGSTPAKGAPGGTPTYPDGLYVYPTLEYQQVVQLDWERLPGYALKNPDGDGWSAEVTVPFKDPTTNEYRSPFGPRPGVCSPAGEYHNNLVAPAKQLRNRARVYTPPGDSSSEGSYDYRNRPYGMPAAAGGQPLTFQNPYPDRTDGRWVQQCLGGIVQAKAEVTIESKLNNAGPAGYQTVWVHATQYLPQDRFAGTDQKQGAAT